MHMLKIAKETLGEILMHKNHMTHHITNLEIEAMDLLL